LGFTNFIAFIESRIAALFSIAKKLLLCEKLEELVDTAINKYRAIFV
jgi:hypothetical protein